MSFPTIPRSALVLSLALIDCNASPAGSEGTAIQWPEFPAAPSLTDSGSPDPYAGETPEQRDARMAWWRHAKFGMFIHWGVYAVPAGVYAGEEVEGIGEWIMFGAKIPIEDYRGYAKEFHPIQYDPESWALLARDAGMKYMVITSKHHDGFALFPSEVTDWDISDSTPHGRDLIGPLAEAARAQSLKFGLYYSQAQDWVHPGGAVARRGDFVEWDESHVGDMDEYIDAIAVPQIKEILTRYRPDVLWWDTPIGMNEERAAKLADLLRLSPNIIHNNRLGGGFKGDTETPEQYIPPTGFEGRDWEVCMTMNDTWGYKSRDDNWKSTEVLVRKLCDIVSKGGNFLLNVGPTKEGRIPQPSIERLKEVGAWMDVNGESIYGTSKTPFAKLIWGCCTKKLHLGGTTLYFHVFEWPDDGKLEVPGLQSKPSSVKLLANGRNLRLEDPSKDARKGVVIKVPKDPPAELVPVIKMEIPGELQVVKVLPEQGEDGRVELKAAEAFLVARSYDYEYQLRLATHDGVRTLENWHRHRDSVYWDFKIHQPGAFTVVAEVSGAKETKLSIENGETEKVTTTIEESGNLESFKVRELAQITISEKGEHRMSLRPIKGGWEPINIRSLTLIPVKE